MAQTGFSRLVVGLSGGVDSATVAFLAARAIDPETCSPCACRIGPRRRLRRPMRSASSTSSAAAPSASRSPRWSSRCWRSIAGDDEAPLNVRRGNVMARQRMIVLYDRSADFDALVIGTSEQDRGAARLRDAARATWPPRSRRSATCTRPSCGRSPPSWACRRRSSTSPRRPTCGPARPMRASSAAATTCSTARSSPSSTAAGRWTDASPPVSTARWSSGSLAGGAHGVQASAAAVAKLSLRTPGFDHLYPRRRPGSRR